MHVQLCMRLTKFQARVHIQDHASYKIIISMHLYTKFTGACVCSLLTCAIMQQLKGVCVHIQCPNTVPGSR